METMNIALPEEMKEFVQTQADAGGYSSVSEYVRNLIREDLRRSKEQLLDELLLEGLRSGPPRRMTKKDWDALRQRARERHAGKKR